MPNSFNTSIPISLIPAESMGSKFVLVLNELQDYKQELLNTYEYSKEPINYKNIDLIKKFLAELGDIPLSSYMTLGVYECLLINAGKILAYKGTLRGITQFYNCVSQGTAVIDASKLFEYPPYIILSDYRNGHLQMCSADDTLNNADYAMYPDGIQYLFSDFAFTMGKLIITISSPFYLDAQFKSYVLHTIPIFFPYVNIHTEIVLTLNPLIH